MLTCPTVDQLERLLAGTLTGAGAVALEEHVKYCDTCSGWLEQARADESLLPDVRRVMALDPAPPDAPDAGDVIGNFRIRRRIGDGGMGIVYEAEQRRPRRIVALKLLRPGTASARTLRRFQFEAEILARLEHPAIAQIHEAGTFETAEGTQPFFAMELVRGLPVTRYAEERSLGTRRRLALLARVADGVNHAHLNGVVHRDLKPSNILVDEDGRPKILDFGVARAADREAEQERRLTVAGELVGTLVYMSPEQLRGDPERIDLRADVYALGLIAYELLARSPAFDLRRQAVADAIRRLTEETPRALGEVDRSLRGDVETIVSKALEKEPVRRYASAAELAQDVRRYLEHEPIVARPPSPSYLARKFVRRHRFGVGAVALILLALAAGVVVSVSYALRAERARASWKTTLAILERTLGSRDLSLVRPPDYTVRQALDETAAELERGEIPDGAAELEVRYVVGNAYRALCRYEEAETHLRRAVELAGQVHGEASSEAASCRIGFAVVRLGRGHAREAAKAIRPAINRLEQNLGAAAEPVATARLWLAEALASSGAFAEAERMLRDVLAQGPEGDGVNREGAVRARVALADLFYDRGDFDAAESLYAELLAVVEADDRPDGASDSGPSPGLRPRVKAKLGALLRRRRDFAHAEPLIREALDEYRAFLGDEHPRVAACLAELASLRANQGRLDEAERHARAALAQYRAFLDDVHPSVTATLRNLGEILLRAGERDQAEAICREALALCRERGASGVADAILLESRLGKMAQQRGNLEEAARRYRAALALAEKDGSGRVDLERIETGVKNNLATILVARGEFDEAEPLFREVLARRRGAGAKPYRIAIALNNLGQLLRKKGEPRQAEPVIREAYGLWRDVAGASHPTTLIGQGNLAAVLVDLERLDEAEALFLEARKIAAAVQPRHWRTAALEVNYARCLIERGRPDEAARLLRPNVPRLRAALGEKHDAVRLAERLLARVER